MPEYSGTATLRTEITAFFAAFEQTSREQEWSRYGEMFLDEFLNLDPTTARAVRATELVAFLPLRKDLFHRAQATGTELASLTIQALDERHVLAFTTWRVLFEREPGPADPHSEVVLRSTFLLRREATWQVAAYLNHENLLELLGLL